MWVRSHIDGQEAALPFTPQELESYRADSAKYGQEAAFVTAICTDVGMGFAVRGAGLETLDQFTGKILLPDYIAKPKDADAAMPC